MISASAGVEARLFPSFSTFALPFFEGDGKNCRQHENKDRMVAHSPDPLVRDRQILECRHTDPEQSYSQRQFSLK